MWGSGMCAKEASASEMAMAAAGLPLLVCARKFEHCAKAGAGASAHHIGKMNGGQKKFGCGQLAPVRIILPTTW
jgi:hypothetical protein